jgi:hypothetical protein
MATADLAKDEDLDLGLPDDDALTWNDSDGEEEQPKKKKR